MNKQINLPFPSKFVEVRGSRMHYFDEGSTGSQRHTFLFLHGNPTSAYLWRDYIHFITKNGYRAVAIDLIGMGLSDKPNINYTLSDHISYINGFIQTLGLKNIIIVGHDWGTAIGLDYFRRNQNNIRGIVLLEGLVNDKNSIQMPWYTHFMMRRMMSGKSFEKNVLENNFFIEQILFQYGTSKPLTDQDKAAYRHPYPDAASRKPLLVWAREVPYNSKPKENSEIIKKYMDALFASSVPVLLFWGKGGVLVTPKDVETFHNRMKNFTDVNLGEIKHYFPEDFASEISQKIVELFYD